MIKLLRTQSQHPDFVQLVKHLDEELAIVDGEDHSFYDQFNKIDNIKHVAMVYIQNTAVGCGAIKQFDKDTMEVKRMFVLKEHRGKGVAGMLLSELEKWAMELGFKRCVLETGSKQEAAIVLYKKSGYHLIPNYGQYIGVDNSFCFEKLI